MRCGKRGHAGQCVGELTALPAENGSSTRGSETVECARCPATTPIKRPLLIVPNQPEFSLPQGWSPFVFQRWHANAAGVTQTTGALCPTCGDEFANLLRDNPCEHCGETLAECERYKQFGAVTLTTHPPRKKPAQCCESCHHKPIPGGNDGQATTD